MKARGRTTDDKDVSANVATATLPAWASEHPYDRCIVWRGRIWSPLGEQLLPCHELLVVGKRLVRAAWNTSPATYAQAVRHASPHLTLMLLAYRRAQATYQALVLLLREGFGEQALPQLRVLFEAMMDLYWIRTHRQDAPTKLLEHERFHSRDWATKLRADANYDGPYPAVEPFADEREARPLRNQYRSSFTGEALYARVAAWEADPTPELRWRGGRDGELRWVYNDLVHHANQHVHGSLHGLVHNGEGWRSATAPSCTCPKARVTSTYATPSFPPSGASTACCV